MSERKEQGRKILAATVGKDYFDKRTASTNDFNRKIRDLTDEYCFGEGWAGKALQPKQRSMLVVAMLAGTGKLQELKTHVNGALNNGCSVEEVQDVLQMVAIYCGIPCGVAGVRVAEEVLKERGLLK
jgi:4-carboxymuconolactone decarboxylase